MPFNDSYANTILNFTMAKVSSVNVPSSVYIGLSSNNPEADGGAFTELSGNGYSRILLSSKGAAFPDVMGAATNREIQNTKQINWTKATGDWIPALGFGLFSSETGGTPFFYGALESPVTVTAGDVALFDPATLKISLPAVDVETT